MKEKILYALKNTDRYISGEELSTSLGVTRSAIWKNINQLRNDGYIIDSVKNKGYKLENNPDMIDIETVLKDFQPETIGKKLIVLKTVDSTNNELKRLAAKGEESGTVVAADVQSAGKGRFGRIWKSSNGGLYFSLLLRIDLPPSDIASITLAAGYAVCLAIRDYTGLDACIKWPNDIIIGSKKICGILTEMAAQSDCIEYVVTGIGINTGFSEFPEEIRHKATSLFIETQHKIDKSDFFRTVLIYLDKVLSSFLVSVSLDDINNFKKLCTTLGRNVSVERNGSILTGIAKDISPLGELIIETLDLQTIKISSGEVTVQGIY